MGSGHTKLHLDAEGDSGVVRRFSTGASRDTEEGKWDYEGFLSPLVLQEFARYMHDNRVQKDGSLRDSDNWQKGFGDEHLDVCMKSLSRHYIDAWLAHRGHPAKAPLIDSLCAIIFNTQAYIHKLLLDELEEEL